MRFICSADLHIRGKRPRMRKDDFVEAQFRKLKQMINLCEEYDTELLIAGDLFDRWDVSLNILRQTAEILRPWSGRIYVIRGNHCTNYHNKSIDKSPLGLLSTTGIINYIDDEEQVDFLKEKVSVYGMGWQGDHCEIRPRGYNILLSHFSVYEKKPPPYMPNALSVKDFEKTYPGFDRYVVGDIHITCQKSKTIVPGSMMRSNSDQQKHKPCVFLLDTDNDSVRKIFLTLAEDVFDLEAIEEVRDSKIRVDAQADQLLTMTKKMKSVEDIIDFDTILQTTSENSSENVKQLIREAMLP